MEFDGVLYLHEIDIGCFDLFQLDCENRDINFLKDRIYAVDFMNALTISFERWPNFLIIPLPQGINV